MPDLRPWNPNRYEIREDPDEPWRHCLYDTVSGYYSVEGGQGADNWFLTDAIMRLHNEPGKYPDEQMYRFFHNFTWRKSDGTLTQRWNYI